MKVLLSRLVLLISVFIPIMFAPNVNYTCTWQDTFHAEFLTPQVNTQQWVTTYPSGNGGEMQYYSPDALQTKNGLLIISADKKESNGYPYTSGIVLTKDKFSQLYGFFTIRVKLPKGQGLWPAFWLLPAKKDYPTEIDIFELHGDKPNTIYMSNHWRDKNIGITHDTTPYTGPDFTQDFHIFSLEWRPDALIWYVDGKEVHRMTKGVPQEPMFLILNLAVGGRWPGNPDGTTLFPSIMQVDYIRVYQRICESALAF